MSSLLKYRLQQFQSTHPARGATPGSPVRGRGCGQNFNPRTPRGVRLFVWRLHLLYQYNFNPRTPRGVRRTRFFPVTLFRYFNPRTPRGVRLRRRGGSPLYAAISIHAPREGCDQIQAHPDPPTAPISIHAPREGCDLVTAYTAALAVYFNPRTPRGVRQGGSQCLRLGIVFQSTHPARGATQVKYKSEYRCFISIHAPREGCDLCSILFAVRLIWNFNPRTPRGVRRDVFFIVSQSEISIHAPREGCDP